MGGVTLFESLEGSIPDFDLPPGRRYSHRMSELSKLWQALLDGVTPESKIVQTLLGIALFIVLRRALTSLLSRGRSVQVQYQIRKGVTYVSYVSGLVVVGNIWFAGFESLTTYAGLLSAGVAIALQAPLVNLAGWLFVIWRRPFEVGDRVQVGEHRGDVIDQRLFMFSLLEVGNWVDADQSTGRVLHIPNGKLFSEVTANYSQGFHYIWNEVPVLLTFESDWRGAKEILTEVAERLQTDLGEAAEQKVRDAAKKYLIFYSHLTPVVYTSVKDSGVLLTLRYLCEPRRRRTTEQEIWEQLLDAFAESPRIDFAYPTQRLYSNDREGKPQTRPTSLYGRSGSPAVGPGTPTLPPRATSSIPRSR